MHFAPSRDHWLDLKELVTALLAQGRLEQDGAEQALSAGRQPHHVPVHPLVFLARQQLVDPSRHGKTLDLETSPPGWQINASSLICALIRSKLTLQQLPD